MEKVVLPIHFEDRSGYEFERLCFAYIVNTRDWDSIDWYGQVGNDRGRDIWGTLAYSSHKSTVCYQCVNRKMLEFNKAHDDIDKLCSGPNNIPEEFILIVGGKVSAKMRDRVKAYAKQKGIYKTEIWDGTEFEERLRKNTPSLLRRFTEGEEFPEITKDLAEFSNHGSDWDDTKILEMYSRCFNRPAFTTPFHKESSLPYFEKAITDTIEAFNTGVYRLRDGTLIRHIPCVDNIQDKNTRNTIREIVIELQKLRSSFNELLKLGTIRHCNCGNPDCPTFMLTNEACYEMDRLREKILEQFRIIYPRFEVKMWH